MAEEFFVARCAGLDVHLRTVTATVRVPGPDGGRRQETATFGTTVGQLRRLADWLAGAQVTLVGMESTQAAGAPHRRQERRAGRGPGRPRGARPGPPGHTAPPR